MTTEVEPRHRGARLVARESAGIQRTGEPVLVGVPFASGTARNVDRLEVRRGDGARIPHDAWIVDRWPDGSARWVHVAFAADVAAHGEAEWHVSLDGEGGAAPDGPALEIRETDRGVFVETGAASFAVDIGDFRPFRSVRTNGVEQVDAARSGLEILDAEGQRWNAVTRAITVEQRGTQRATLRVDGTFDGPEDAVVMFIARLRFFAGRASAQLDLTVRNTQRAEHPGGHWELGDAGSVCLEDLSLVLATGRSERASWSIDAAAPLASTEQPVEIYQDSSGGPHWNSRVHLTRDRKIGSKFSGYRVKVGGDERSGSRANPRVAAHDGHSGVGLSMPQFWPNFPKAMEASPSEVRLRLFPQQFGALHELQGGEQKTHTLWLHFGEEALAAAPDHCRAPLVVHPDPNTVAESGAIPYLTPREGDPNPRWLALVDQAIEGPDTFDHKREQVDEWGWRHFGEIFADHESKFHEGQGAFISHYNNQYDVVHGALLQFLKSGDERWYHIMNDLARHVVDIDIYHCTSDKPAYNQGLFWHTVHYIDGDLSTHRSYPKNGSEGGGPDDEHNYTTGLLHWWLVTGQEHGRETALNSAQWVLDADDPEGTVFRHLDRSPTGLASKTRDFDYHGPGRGAGNSINALVDAWRATGDAKWIAKCEELIRRTVHPSDDPNAMNLIDAENRWSYTVHLQALGKYLDTKAAHDQIDENYAYAQQCLLHYARWIADHEKLTLSEPDKLDHPTETWAAQDVRKADVLLFAALHARGEEREHFLARAQYFFDESIAELERSPTRSYMRPVIVLMHYGHLKSWVDRRRGGGALPERPLGPAIDPGPKQHFVPQKLRAMAKAKRIAAVGAAVFVAAVAGGLFWFFGG